MTYRNGMPFAFWCHKVLPLVYDESLSYYEFLCKLSKILQEVMEHDVEQDESIERLQQDISNLGNTIRDLKGCIALEYDANNMYSEGMFCLMNDDLYICTESTTGEFDRNCWSHTNFGNQITSTNQAISSMDTRVLYTERAIERIDGTIGDIQGDISTINSRIESVITKLAPTYNENLNYSIGQYCTYMRGFYVCTANTTGTFDSECWDSTDVGYNLADLYGKYENLNVLVNGAMNALKAVMNISANEYNKTATYNRGDYCTYGWVMFKCNSDNVTGNFDDNYWDETTVGDELILAMSGGGSGNVSVPTYDENSWYWKFDFVEHNGTVYMCKATNTSGTFSPSDWVALEPCYITTGSYRTLGADYGEWHGDAVKGEVTIYRDATTGKISLWKCNVANASVPFDSSEFRVTDLVTEHNMLSNLTSGYRVETYDSTKTYNKGDIVIDNRGLCEKCKEDGVTGTWDGTKWDDTNMFEVLASVVKTLNNLNLYNGNLVDRFSTNVTEVI